VVCGFKSASVSGLYSRGNMGAGGEVPLWRGVGPGPVVVPKPERGPRRWKRWAEMVAGGMSKAEVARVEGVSRVAVTNAFRKLKN
jgi:hypothetical protein